MDAHKQFTTVYIKDSGVENTTMGRQNGLEQVQMRVKGNFQGIDRHTLEPLPGKFEASYPKHPLSENIQFAYQDREMPP